MPDKKEPLSFKLVTTDNREALFNEASEYVQAIEPCEPRDRQFALACYNDVHPAFGGGSRYIMWFDSERELLESIPGFVLVLDVGPCGPIDCVEISKNLASVVSAYWMDEIPYSQAKEFINQLAADCFQVEWWGKREKLLKSDEEFPKWLRSGWRGSEDTSPLAADELEKFFEYLSCDYMC